MIPFHLSLPVKRHAVLFSAVLALNAAAQSALPRPLTLETALAYATEHNPALLRTAEQIKEQEGVLVQVKSAYLPSVGANAAASRTDDGLLESPLYKDHGWKLDITARQVLYNGGGNQARVRGERERLEAARLSFTAALNDTVLGLNQQFHAVLLAREIISVHEESLRVLEAALQQARDRRNAGTASDFEVLRAEVSVANEKPVLIRARNNYRVAQDRLRTTLGAPAVKGVQTDLELQGTLAVTRRKVDLEQVLEAAHTQRPELARQSRVIAAAEQDIRSAKSGYLPTLTASAGYQWTGTSMETTPRSHLDGWAASVQGSWAIFDGRATAGKVRQNQSRLRQVKHADTELQLAVDLDVREAYSTLTEADELLNASEKVVEQAQESLRLTQTRLQAGTATQLDLLQAQSALTDSRSNFAQAQYSYIVATASLQRAMGLR